MQILVGADPEVFVADTSGKLISADKMVEGTKHQPCPVDNGAVQVDGMALEFNIDPASNQQEFIHNIMSVKQTLHEMIGVNDYSLLASPSVVFDQDVMDKASRNAKMLGCEPDFNAWRKGEVNPKPDGTGNMRTGAGHVHIGFTEGEDVHDLDHRESCLEVIKQLDCSLGIQSLLWDDDNERRDMYGKAGAFRFKPYGAEYRVLSNAWLRSAELVGHVYDTTIKAVEDLLEGNMYEDDISAQDIINSGDAAAAYKAASLLADKYGVPMMEPAYV